jgi:hypothetical protein
MERCYVKQNLYLQDAIRAIAKEEGWGVNKMAAFAVATKEGLFSVRILIEEDEIKINKINLSESYVVTYNTLYNEDGSIETFTDCVSRDVFESGILNRNENFKVSLLLDYKKNPIKTLGGEKIVKVFIGRDNRLNVFTQNPIKEVKMEKIGDLPKETIYFGERDGLCSCQRKPKDPYETRWLSERFFNEILDSKDQIILVKVNDEFQAIKLLKAFELLPDGWYINICKNNDEKLTKSTYCISKQKDDFVEFYLNFVYKNVFKKK